MPSSRTGTGYAAGGFAALGRLAHESGTNSTLHNLRPESRKGSSDAPMFSCVIVYTISLGRGRGRGRARSGRAGSCDEMSPHWGTTDYAYVVSDWLTDLAD
ncbi:hypothetical protein JCM12141A_52220 [Mycolicibacterium hodleri]